MNKTCRDCYEQKPLEAFYRDARRPDGHRANCKDCTSHYYRKGPRSNNNLLRKWKRVDVSGHEA